MSYRRIDVWSGNEADTPGRALENSIRVQAGCACESLISVEELLTQAMKSGHLERGEITAGADLVQAMTQMRWLLTATLLQPSEA